MNIDIDLDQLIELNRIKGLLQSPDFEAQVLGFEMFKNSGLFKNRLYDLSYEVKSGKLIPISWFVRKATEIITKKAREQDCYENFTSLIEPIINSVLLCEPKFISQITFNANPHRLMRNYSETSVLNNYLPDQPQTESDDLLTLPSLV